MRRSMAADTAAVAFIAVLAAQVLMPAAARIQRSSAEARCQSNLRSLAGAISAYSADYAHTYPTNRRWSAPGIPGGIVESLSLSPAEIDPTTGQPYVFVSGIAWVEGLYPYLMAHAERTSQDWTSFWRCPNASDTKYPVNSLTARVAYTMNACLVEQPTAIVGQRHKVLMLRETDRLVTSILRPAQSCIGSDTPAPRSPFLNNYDFRMGSTDPNQHGTGSYIVLADGHVAHFDFAYYAATDADYGNKKGEHWDPQTRQWYNWFFPDPINEQQRMLDRSIAISP